MILDTNIIIALLNEEREAVATVTNSRQNGRALFVSVVTIAETLSLPTLTTQNVAVITDFLKTFIPTNLKSQTL